MSLTSSRTRERSILTSRGIENLVPSVEAYRVPDVRAPGLAVRVAPGGHKTWDVAFRISGKGKVRRTSLGRTSDVSLEAARSRTNDLTAAARKGRDLLAEEEAKRKEEEARTTVSELIEQYVRRRVKGRLRTAAAIESRLWRALSPVTAKFADELQRRDIRQLLDAAADQGIEREAEQRRQTIGAMFRWALSQDIVAVDPTAGLAGYDPGVPRDRVLTAREVRLLWAWLGEPEQAIPPAKILKLELLLGARCGEIGGMRTSEIDPEQWLWTLPPERSKNGRARVTPLLGIARDILRDQLAEATSCYLFTTERGTPFAASNVGAFLLNRAARLPVNKFTSHDLRRTVATMLAEKSVPLDAIASVLGHDAGTRETRILVRHYVKSGLIEQKKNVLELWDVLVRDMIGEPWALPQRTGGGPDD